MFSKSDHETRCTSGDLWFSPRRLKTQNMTARREIAPTGAREKTVRGPDVKMSNTMVSFGDAEVG
jgi:hypothetical protein